jgi:hypothetical protein
MPLPRGLLEVAGLGGEKAAGKTRPPFFFAISGPGGEVPYLKNEIL